MYLTKEEEQILDGEFGWALQKAIKLLIKIGEIYGAERLIPIKKSQVAGVSYKTSGDPTLNLIKDIAKSGVKVRTTASLNPAGMPLEGWEELHIPEDFARKQIELINAYAKLGIKTWCTCTPYYMNENRPEYGEVVGFSESSAIAFVNSVIGARTNRHGGLDALSAALVGRVPEMGLVIKENRFPNLIVNVEHEMKSQIDFAILGGIIGKYISAQGMAGTIPYYKGIKINNEDYLKTLGAASAATGSVALYHVENITAEVQRGFLKDFDFTRIERVTISDSDFKKYIDEFEHIEKPDLVSFGCPHYSIKEIEHVVNYVGNRKATTKFWISVAPQVLRKAIELGYKEKLDAANIKLIPNTCVVVAPVEKLGIRYVLTNSAKAAEYIPKLSKNYLRVELASTEECIDIVCK